MAGNGPSEQSPEGQQPSSSSPSPSPEQPRTYTRIYPVRSLLGDIQRAANSPPTANSSAPATTSPSPTASSPANASKDDFHILSDALLGDRNTQLRRTALWQANISSAPPSSSPPSAPEEQQQEQYRHSTRHSKTRARSDVNEKGSKSRSADRRRDQTGAASQGTISDSVSFREPPL